MRRSMPSAVITGASGMTIGQGDSGFGAAPPSRHLLGTESLYDDAVALLDQLVSAAVTGLGRRSADSSVSAWRLATPIASGRWC